MRTLLLLALLFGAFARAQDSADESAVRRAVAALNRMPPPAAIEQLWKDKPPIIRVRMVAQPTVVISHEPWGEARIGWPGSPIIEVVTPRIETRSIRFLTPDVALADAVCNYDSRLTPLLIVLKKDGAEWNVAALRILAVLQ